MYSIGHVIYGIPLTDEISKVAQKRGEELDIEDGGWFELLYHGGSYREVGYLGVELASFDECADFRLHDIVKYPTNDNMRDVAALYEQLPDEYKEVALEVSVWVVFSSS